VHDARDIVAKSASGIVAGEIMRAGHLIPLRHKSTINGRVLRQCSAGDAGAKDQCGGEPAHDDTSHQLARL
jgi:hypothetical protein